MSDKDDGYADHETSSIYVDPRDRFVVSLIVGYDDDADGSNVQSPKEAAHYALKLTTDEASDGTFWFVFDRKTKEMHQFEQSDFETMEDDYL